MSGTKNRCQNCGRFISFDLAFRSWYHTLTEAARCEDDASFTFAEPKRKVRR